MAGTDTEFLHDLRVSVRRTRSAQRELKSAFPPAALERFRREFRWLQQATGPARDLDVYVGEFDAFRAALPAPSRADLDPLRELLVRRRAHERRGMVRALRSARKQALRRRCSRRSLLRGGPDASPDARHPLGAHARRRIGGRGAHAGIGARDRRGARTGRPIT